MTTLTAPKFAVSLECMTTVYLTGEEILARYTTPAIKAEAGPINPGRRYEYNADQGAPTEHLTESQVIAELIDDGCDEGDAHGIFREMKLDQDTEISRNAPHLDTLGVGTAEWYAAYAS